MSPSQFRKAIARGDVTAALTRGPFGYVSSYRDGGFRFEFTSGPMRGQYGMAPTLLDAIRKAMSEPASPTTSAVETPEPRP